MKLLPRWQDGESGARRLIFHIEVESMRCKLLIAFVLVTAGTMFAQSAPVKMGLWEKKMVIDNGDGSPSTMIAKDCMTQEAWEKAIGDMGKQHPGCDVKYVKNPHGYTYSGSCTNPRSALTMDGSTTVQDAEHIISESHSVITTNGKKRELRQHATSRFISADCGTIKLGDPEIE